MNPSTRRRFLQQAAKASGAAALLSRAVTGAAAEQAAGPAGGSSAANAPEVAACAPSTRPAPKAPRPDILFLMPDQMRGDCLSILKHPTVRTPAMDALARRGGLFRRAYTTVASCIPARFGMLTGLFPQTSGVVGFAAKPITTPTMPQVLAAAGYATALVGREMHQIAGPEKLGYQRAIRGSTYVSNDDYAAELRQAAPQVNDIRRWMTSIGADYNLWPAAAWPLDDALHPTAWVAAKARALLADSPADKPLFLTASFYAPHPPLVPPKKYFDAYLSGDLPAPARGDWVDYGAVRPPPGAEGGHRVLLEGPTLRRAQAGYFGLIEHLDDQVAPLIAEFIARSEKAGRCWLIVLSTDHGEMLGDHGYFRKCEPFEGAANIPFLLAGSKELGFQAGLRCDQPVCLEDLLPTLAELAGTACPPVDGVSLVPTLRGQTQTLREQLHFEHAPCYSRDQAYHALTDGRHKYIWRPTDGRELLFNLQADPREEHNLAGDPAARKELETWRERMIRRLAPRPEGFSDGKKLIPGRPYKPLMAGVRP